MKEFLKSFDYTHLEDLFTLNGVSGEDFFLLSNDRIQCILNSYGVKFIFNFVFKLNFYKEWLANKSEVIETVELNERVTTESVMNVVTNGSARTSPLATDESLGALESNNSCTSMITLNVKSNVSTCTPPLIITNIPPNESSCESTDTISLESSTIQCNSTVEVVEDEIADTEAFKNNELFTFLTDPCNLEGNIVWGKYKRLKIFDHYRLKNLIILNEIKKKKDFTITGAIFQRIRDQYMQLLPTEDPDLFYRPYYISEEKEAVSAAGSLYNHYKFVRHQLRLAGILSEDAESAFADDYSELESNYCHLECLMDPNREKYINSRSQIICAWEKSFSERSKLLNPGSKSKETLQKYVDSFACLQFPLGTVLLESDFAQRIKNLEESQNLPQKNYSTLFIETWPSIASKLLKIHERSRIKEVKEFFTRYKELIDEGTLSSILGLLLPPYCITVPKTPKQQNSTITFTKCDIAKYFILHVENPENLGQEKDKFEQQVKELNLTVHPYVIICGQLRNITNSYVIIKSEKYEYQDPLMAVQSCFKCLFSLRSWPSVCDHIWIFIANKVYCMEGLKNYSAVIKLISDLPKNS